MVSGPVGVQDTEGIYVINVIGGTIQEIRQNGEMGAISPDGSQVVFVAGHNNEIWEMSADGENAHRVFAAASSGVVYFEPTWAPNGQRFSYFSVTRRAGGNFGIKLMNRSAIGSDPVTVVDNPNLRNFLYLRDDRLLFTLRQTAPDPEDANLWDIRVDPATGKPEGSPRRLTDWTGISFDELSANAAGNMLAYVNDQFHSDVMVGQLASGGAVLSSPSRFVLSDRMDWPGGWTADGKSVLFYSDRNGRFDLYKQSLGERTAQAIGTAPEEKRTPQMSPDGRWIVYISWPLRADLSAPPGGHIMRMPVGGGPPAPAFAVKGYADSDVPGTPDHNVMGFPSFRCPSKPGALCVLAERDRAKKEIVFTTFDPVEGKKQVVARVQTPVDEWALSPDGSRIATTSYAFGPTTIRITPIGGGKPSEIAVKDWIRLMSLGWAPDGNGLFACSDSARGTTLLHIAMNGDAQPLFRNGNDFYLPTASPDGHHLAFGAVVNNSNAWLIPHLPKP